MLSKLIKRSLVRNAKFEDLFHYIVKYTDLVKQHKIIQKLKTQVCWTNFDAIQERLTREDSMSSLSEDLDQEPLKKKPYQMTDLGQVDRTLGQALVGWPRLQLLRQIKHSYNWTVQSIQVNEASVNLKITSVKPEFNRGLFESTGSKLMVETYSGSEEMSTLA